MESVWMKEYVAAKLLEIEAELDDLDVVPDSPQRDERREHLGAMQARLVASLATNEDEHPLNR
jgi:hypothetical protein